MQLDLTQYPVDGSIVVNGVVYVPKQQEKLNDEQVLLRNLGALTAEEVYDLSELRQLEDFTQTMGTDDEMEDFHRER